MASRPIRQWMDDKVGGNAAASLCVYSLALPIEATLTIVSTGASPSCTSKKLLAAVIDSSPRIVCTALNVRSSEGLVIKY